jgi:hypothetical protein
MIFIVILSASFLFVLLNVIMLSVMFFIVILSVMFFSDAEWYNAERCGTIKCIVKISKLCYGG